MKSRWYWHDTFDGNVHWGVWLGRWYFGVSRCE